MAVERHCRAVGMASPAAHRQINSIVPENRKRIPADKNGGMVSTVNRIARYVEPQTVYTASKATQIFVFT